MEKKDKIYVFGHKNPDTDSICLASNSTLEDLALPSHRLSISQAPTVVRTNCRCIPLLLNPYIYSIRPRYPDQHIPVLDCLHQCVPDLIIILLQCIYFWVCSPWPDSLWNDFSYCRRHRLADGRDMEYC